MNEPRNTAYTPDYKYRHIEEDLMPQELSPQQLEMKKAGEEKAQTRARQTARQTHEEREVGHVNGHEHCEHDQGAAERKTPRLELPVAPVAVREKRAPSVLEESLFQDLDGGEERQRVRQQRLGHQEEVDDGSDARRQVVRDHLLGLVGPRQVGHQGEQAFEDAGSDVSPVHHAVELAGLLHVPLQRGQEDLRGVAEDDDADGDGELLDVDVELDLVPRPVSRPRQTVGDDQDVDDKVRDGAEQAELGHGFEVLEEGARQKSGGGDDGPGPLGHGKGGEAVVHQVSAHDDVQNAGHHELNDLGYVDDVASQRGKARRAARVGNIHIRVSHSYQLAVFVLFVEASDEDFPRVAAHDRGEYNEEQSEISAVENGVG